MIEICIGSACHLKGSYQVIQEMKSLLQKHNMTLEVELKSSFCIGQCGNGVSIRLNGGVVHKVQADQVESFFNQYVLGN